MERPPCSGGVFRTAPYFLCRGRFFWLSYRHKNDGGGGVGGIRQRRPISTCGRKNGGRTDPVIHSTPRQDNRKSKCCMTSSLLRGDGTNEPRDNLSSAADLFYVRPDRRTFMLALSSVCPSFLPHSTPYSIPEGDVRSPFHFAPPAVRPSVQPGALKRASESNCIFTRDISFALSHRPRSLHTILGVRLRRLLLPSRWCTSSSGQCIDGRCNR